MEVPAREAGAAQRHRPGAGVPQGTAVPAREAGTARRARPGAGVPQDPGAGVPQDTAVPGQPTRRRVLAGSLATALMAGCSTGPDALPAPDPLQALWSAALADAALADAAAAAHPDLAPSAGALAADRRAHAESIAAEVQRATPSPSASSTATLAAVVVPTDRAPAAGALADATRAAQAQAAALVTSLPRYRAGLVASVAACCASHLAVLG